MKKVNKKVKKKAMKPWLKNILYALLVIVFGLILLGLTFFFYFGYDSLIRAIIGLFIPFGPDIGMDLFWMPPLIHLSFFVVIGLISWLIFKSKLKVIYKAIYLVVPVAVVLVTLGIFLYQLPIILYPLGALLCLGTLYIFYRTKQPWLYYYTVVLVSIYLAIFTLLGGEI